MIKQIPFDPALAAKAWIMPTDGGKFYLLYTRDGSPVLPLKYAKRGKLVFPFVGKGWFYHSTLERREFTTYSWSKTGKWLVRQAHEYDLILYEGEIEQPVSE
ncbi:MAG: hypothetical protein E7074_03440 [Bacteroidales bacterium]|nr:hypothetical protein [Bacteroidales bacterium]